MMRLPAAVAIGACSLALAACAPLTGTPSSTAPAAPTSTGSCNATAAQIYLAQIATPAVVEAARNVSGATVVRTVRPGEMITLDFRTDRLTLTLDAANAIVQASCG